MEFVNDQSDNIAAWKVCQVLLYGARTGSRIKLTFSDFSMSFSKLYIVDGIGPLSGNRIEAYSRATESPSSFESETNAVGILFTSDLTPGTGVKIEYTITEGSGNLVELVDGVLEEQPATLGFVFGDGIAMAFSTIFSFFG